ncbi:polyisoprenoid-binding protein YceI [Luteibacter rhizovicinus]|uniref:Polyisoprenoid-binding protein YceI n=1 Tax=Luteibacter rhizovicinus TaxID=242606 RepID=A0A4R3YUP8_9GAMM|nr:YceI family protein [Luteibacter rhizovicinus]TCV96331.1 polyisoprenoid-binding protein YceI [Luteibacter rhizovicinus]
MKRALRHIVPAAIFLFTTAPAGAADLRIDPVKSHAEFGVRLLWVSTVSGVFDNIRGDIAIDRINQTAVVDAVIDADSIRMESARLRRWVLAPEFFDSVHYPQIQFVSTPTPLESLTHGGTLQGRLTIRGITRDVDFRLLPSPCPTESMDGCVVQVQGTIDRTDFDMLGRRGALSDRVNLGLIIVLAMPEAY